MPDNLNRDAIEYLVNVGRDEVKTIEIKGETFTNGNFRQMNLEKPPLSQGITVNTLTSFIDYIQSNKDGLDISRLTVLVRDERDVVLLSAMDEYKRRESYVDCVAKLPRIDFNTYMDSEDFNILMQSCFVDDGETDRAAILKVIGNITEDAVKDYTDDGVSQKVTIRTGIQLVQDAKVPNPVILCPYSTFPEIRQPKRRFVLRLQEGAKCALFEADGGTWKNKAMLNIKAFLADKLKGEVNGKGLSILA